MAAATVALQKAYKANQGAPGPRILTALHEICTAFVLAADTFAYPEGQWKTKAKTMHEACQPALKQLHAWMMAEVGVLAKLPASADGALRDILKNYGDDEDYFVKAKALVAQKFVRVNRKDKLLDQDVLQRDGEASYCASVLWAVCGKKTDDQLDSPDVLKVGESGGIDLRVLRWLLDHNSLIGAPNVPPRPVLEKGAVLQFEDIDVRYKCLNELRTMLRVTAQFMAKGKLDSIVLGQPNGMEPLGALDLDPPEDDSDAEGKEDDAGASASGGAAGAAPAQVQPVFQVPEATGDTIRDQHERAFKATQWLRQVAGAEMQRERLEALFFRTQIKAAIALVRAMRRSTFALEVLVRDLLGDAAFDEYEDNWGADIELSLEQLCEVAGADDQAQDTSDSDSDE